jgi:hypothetical protein
VSKSPTNSYNRILDLERFAVIMGAASAREALPASCQGCGNAGGPDACGFSANQQ